MVDGRRVKGDATREAIVRTALESALERGLEGISLGTLAEQLGLSKSGVFAHFKSKEALQLAVLDDAIERYAQRVFVPALAAPRGEPRVRALFENKLAWIENSGFGTGCFFMSLVQEYDDRPGVVRDRVVASQVEWRQTLAKAVSLAVSERQFASSVDPELVAFELIGITDAFHDLHKLHRDPRARTFATRAFERLIADCRVRRRT